MTQRLFTAAEAYTSNKLYHYSKEKYDQLQSYKVTHNLSDKDLKQEIEWAKKICDKYPRSTYISLFMDPIPYKTIASIFNHEHDFWKSGTRLFEYTVMTESLPKDVYYEILETPLNVDLIENVSDKFITVTEEEDRKAYEEGLQAFKCFLARKKLKVGEVGEGINNLDAQIDRFKGLTEIYFKEARNPKYKYYDPTLYACYVPHVQLHTESGIIQYASVKEITIK